MYKTILLAYDGSEEGRDALINASDLAHFQEAQLHLLAVTPLQSGMSAVVSCTPDTLLPAEARHYRDSLEQAVHRLTERGFRATGHLAHGEPVQAIAAKARALEAQLIVLEHHYRGAFASRWWRGAAGAYLMEQAPCSILVVVEPRDG